MKSKLLLISHCQMPVQGLLAGVVLLVCNSATGQNLLNNPDFEEELGPDNWTIVYTGVSNSVQQSWPKTCTASDFVIQGRTRLGHKDAAHAIAWDGEDGTGTNYWNKMGLHFKGSHDWQMHAYASQVVAGLVAGANYTATCWMGMFESDQPDKFQVYMGVLGGANGLVYKRSQYVTSIIKDNTNGWTQCVVTHTASDAGTIEIRLHYNKMASTSGEKWRNMDALYDHASLMLTAGPTNYQPAYTITAVSRTSQEVALSWDTVMNNSYRVQASTNVADPSSWVMLERERNVDPKLFATGSSLTFQTNLVSLFYYNPPSVKVPHYFDPTAPLFFRIYAEPFVP